MSREESSEKIRDNHGSKFSSERPCIFYKLIVDSIIRDRKLMIPKKFVKRYGHKLATVAFLAVPSSSEWPVEIQRAGNRFWFHQGWHEFLEYHSIHAGYFLIFSYEGNSKFSVSIYDLACSRTKSSRMVPRSSEESNIEKQCSGAFEESVKANEFVSMFNIQYQKKYERPTPQVDASKFQKKIQCTRNTGTQTDTDELEENEERKELHSAYESKRTYKGKKRTKADVHVSSSYNEKLETKKSRRSLSSKHMRRPKDVTTAEKEKATHASELCIPANPSFRVALCPYNINCKLVHVPRSFATKHLHGIPLLLTLQLSDGKQWFVKCVDGGRGSGKLSMGWTKFARDNNLKEGDICVFELIEAKKMVLKVNIFRVLEDARETKKSSK